MRRIVIIAALAWMIGCAGTDEPPAVDAAAIDAAAIDGAITLDGGVPADAMIDAARPSDGGPIGVAPADAIPGEESAISGDVDVDATAERDAVIRVDASPDEHITFFLSFDRADADVELEILRWDGATAAHLGTTDGGRGLRTLAVLDADGPRTFWARITSLDPEPFTGTLTITRVPFEDGPHCVEDCAHLLQLPLPNDARDGYASTSSTVFRYQYGRRDLVMFVRHAGQQMAALGMDPILPEDFSQWNGETPGNDVGAPRHASHQRGKDVDISLYGLDGRSVWRSYCTTASGSGGRECVAGSIDGYDGAANAIFFGDFFATGRVTMCFLDEELIPATVSGAEEAASLDQLDASLVPLYSDGRHLQHWPNHDNHIHVRVSEADTTAGLVLSMGAPEAFEPP